MERGHINDYVDDDEGEGDINGFNSQELNEQEASDNNLPSIVDNESEVSTFSDEMDDSDSIDKYESNSSLPSLDLSLSEDENETSERQNNVSLTNIENVLNSGKMSLRKRKNLAESESESVHSDISQMSRKKKKVKC